MYDITEVKKFIMVMNNKEVFFNEIRNGINYHDLEECGLVLVNTVEENREGLYRRDLLGSRESRQALSIFGYL